MSTAVMPTSAIYDLELLLKNPQSGLSSASSTISNSSSSGGASSLGGFACSSSSSASASSPASPPSLLLSSRPPTDAGKLAAAMRWNEEREALARRASHPVAPASVASLVSSFLWDNINNHRRLDRSQSEPAKPLAVVNTSRYKTELCRPYEESGSCKYGDKCQFAHGEHELRSLVRHPKYKTELCRTFHTDGFCPYGARCHFIHAEEPARVGPKHQRPRPLSIRSNGDSPSPPSSLGSGSPPPSATAHSAFTFSSAAAAPLGSAASPARSLSPPQSPPPPPASPDARLPVFNKLSHGVVQLTLHINELIA